MSGIDLTEAVEAAWDVLDEDGHNGLDCRPDAPTTATAERAVRATLLHLEKQIREDCLQRLGRALFAVDSKHHLNGAECLCGFVGDARKRTQTEHITAAVLEEYRHD